jgi:hypothetical protein
MTSSSSPLTLGIDTRSLATSTILSRSTPATHSLACFVTLKTPVYGWFPASSARKSAVLVPQAFRKGGKILRKKTASKTRQTHEQSVSAAFDDACGCQVD